MSDEATAIVASLAPATELTTHESASPLSPSNDNGPNTLNDDSHNDHPQDVQPGAKVALESTADYVEPQQFPKPIGLHSPPDSNSAMKLDGTDESEDSELSDVEDPSLEPDQLPFLQGFDAQPSPQPIAPDDDGKKDEEDVDIGEVTPDHWSGTVPVFKPDMYQFKDFKKFMEKIDSYGMKSGIVKIIPPQEWKDQLPALDDLVKQIRVREPIKQEIMGSNGTYRQVNILHQRSYNLPQWRQLCDQSEHQPPARRGERRAQAPSKPKGTPTSTPSGSKRRGAAASTSGRSTRRQTRSSARNNAAELDERPMTPVSPRSTEPVIDSVEQEIGDDIEDDDPIPSVMGRMGGVRLAKPKEQSTSARRKFARREGSAKIDEEAFKHFDYKMDISDYTPERCEELERIYWKTLTYAPPLYGADVLGTLFDDNTESWNLNKLPNLLDVLGTKVPGVNMAYLYLGMWKATFAWHLEDVDLYSINYLHFGAPKQWYSISQGDARRFENAMKSIWPTDAKACGQFLRHKAFLISPNHLQQYFNIKVNKVVSYPGEFVVTYPYGYHSGYNLGYNCAEAVNFALDSWMPMGKIAKKCECAQAQDSVWVDVYEIERKLRGEETDYEETEDEEEDDDDDDEDEEDEEETGIGLSTPRSVRAIKLKPAGRKRKRATADKGEKKTKKIRLRLKSQVEPPCCLCPHDIPSFELLPTDDGRKAHRLCALYNADIFIETNDGNDVVTNIASVSKDRLDIKCLFCRSKRGVCYQCSHKKCSRSYHATCAAAAGVFVEEAYIPVFSEDGTEYKEQAFEFNCRFHRTKRDRKLDGDTLDDCQKTRLAASVLKAGDICQLQYHRGEIFAGIIVENRESEEMFLVDLLPSGDRMEVEWKWLLTPDPADLRLPHASQNALPMPTSRKDKELINATRKRIEEPPRPDEPFVEGGFVWAEFNHLDLVPNKVQAKVDLSKENQIWYYLGKRSTEARPQYTEDLRKKQHNSKSNFLDTIPRPVPPPAPPRKLYGSTFSIHTPVPVPKTVKPYQYKPREPVQPAYNQTPFTAHHFVPGPSPYTTQHFEPRPAAGNTFVHYTQPMTGPPNYSTPVPLPSPLPYYRFQHSPYIPPGQQSKRSDRKPQAVPPPAPVPKQATPKPEPYSMDQTANPTQQPQVPVPPSTTASTPHVNAHPAQTAYTPTIPPIPKPVSRRSSVALPTTTHRAHGHARSRSSISSHSGRFALGSGQRFGTPPSSYGHARRDSMTKSPFSHGFSQPPGLGPSPSPQNNQFFQTQARVRSNSLISNISLNTPMTSSAIRPSSSTSAQALAGQLQSVISSASSKESRPSVIQKYAFFQVHHNRDSTKYRTPYAHWGGFTNGYEGSLRAHLMRTPDALFGARTPSSSGLNGMHHPGLSSAPPPEISPSVGTSNNSGLQVESPISQFASAISSSTACNTSMPLASSPNIQSAAPYQAAQSSTASESSPWHKDSVGELNNYDTTGINSGMAVHPAIRTHYAALLQNRNVKVENQFEVDNTNQPLSTIPQSLPGSSTLNSENPLPPVNHRSGSSSTSSHGQRGFRHFSPPKSTTPIPPPIVPHSTNPPQIATVKAVTKKTPIPAPRPWENLRKMQTPTKSVISQPSPPVSAFTTPCPPFATVNWQNHTDYGQPQSCEQCTSPVFQANNIVQHVDSPESPAQQPPPSTTEFPTPMITQKSQPTDATDPYLPITTIIAAPSESIQHPTITGSVPIYNGDGTPDLPEVSDGSMELVESIIRNAQMASGSFFGFVDEAMDD